MPNPLSFITSRRTLQSAQADSRQRENHAGGFTFVVDPDTRLRRFLGMLDIAGFDAAVPSLIGDFSRGL